MSNPNISETIPFLPEIDDNNDEDGRWWKNVLDLEEAKKQVLFSLPMIVTNVVYFSITLVSVMFAGHLGELQLAGATLANSWATVTGFAFMTGLSGALETLCGQGFGAKFYRILGIYLQSSCIISCSFAILISILWFFTEPILIFLQQDAEISKTAAIYIKYLIPGLFAYGLVQNILRFLQSQSILMPLVWFSVLPLGLHLAIVYALVNWTDLGFKGAPLAASISLWISLVLLSSYVVLAQRFEETWPGLSSESFRLVFANLKLAIPSAAMVCTRVSNELGAENPRKAKTAMAVSLKLSILLALIVVVALAFGHNIWAAFFTNTASIINQFASITPFLLISISIDSFQGILSGVARGSGWQVLAVWANLATFYLIGMPVAGLLAFKFKLYAKGLWIGLICGLSCQAGALLLITLYRKWTKIELS
ncbi:hypothetical protein ERO13_A04G032800v2 [Gossypium hirsutum]|uniref:Protein DETOXIFICATION 18 isoform X7 n=1 Tax=Gossypium hirsutum TaxID=3635 RepID=A0ABM3BI81_GOSHI|nr:protein DETOXIFICATION 18-like isoform X7 [Gossypium hirsutum]KAG4204184.1 hypothetical protein ERO13_A04G032800v2 [Gossypium hirsutum]